MPFLLVLSTAPTGKAAQKITQILLDKRLVACVNIVGGVQSFYWWKGKKAKGREVLMLIKTQAKAYPKLERVLAKIHPYSLPEIIAFPIARGSKSYLGWISKEVRA